LKGLLVQKLVDASIPWQQQLLMLTLRVGIVLGAVVYVPSMASAWRADLIGLMVLDTVVLAAVVTLYLADQWSNRVRSMALCLIVYVLSVGLLLTVGPISQIYLFGFSILTTLLLGLRVGLYAAALSAVSLLTVGAAGLAAGMELPNGTGPLLGWVTIVLNFALVNVLLTLAVGLVISALEHALEREIVGRRTIERERTFLRTLIDAIPDLVYTKDLRGRYVTCNRATLARFKLEDESRLVGKTVFDMLPPDSASAINAQDLEVMTGRQILNIDGLDVDAEGKPAWYQTIRVPMRDAEGVINGIVGVSRDITELKNLEAQLRQSQKMEAIGQLTGGVAHDFNNLLMIILGNVELLELANLSQEDADTLASIGQAAESAARLTSQLLTFARQAHLNQTRIDVNALVSDTVSLLRTGLPETVKLNHPVTHDLWPVDIDANSLQQAIVNLAMNANAAMPRGGEIVVTCRNLLVDDDMVPANVDLRPDRYVAISVSDNGHGMPPEVLARAFEPFFTTKDVGKGTALGLSTVYGFAKQSNGGVSIYSEPGRGTTVNLYLPAAEEGASQDAHPEPAIEAKIPPHLKRILVVEDQPQVRAHVEKTLARFGYAVASAQDAAAALTMLEHGEAFDLLFTDIIMPGGMNGQELGEAALQLAPQIKILYTSGYPAAAFEHLGLKEQNSINFLSKPYKAADLQRILADIFDD